MAPTMAPKQIAFMTGIEQRRQGAVAWFGGRPGGGIQKRATDQQMGAVYGWFLSFPADPRTTVSIIGCPNTGDRRRMLSNGVLTWMTSRTRALAGLLRTNPRLYPNTSFSSYRRK